jgi:hypothetical protein
MKFETYTSRIKMINKSILSLLAYNIGLKFFQMFLTGNLILLKVSLIMYKANHLREGAFPLVEIKNIIYYKIIW